MQLAALNHDWTDFEPLGDDDLAELIERVATLEAKQDATKESLDEAKAIMQHHVLQSEFRFNETRQAIAETDGKIDKLISGLEAKDAAAKTRTRDLTIAASAVGSVLTILGGFVWANAKAVVAFLATVFR